MGATLVAVFILVMFSFLLLRIAPVYWGEWVAKESTLWLYPDARAIRNKMQSKPPLNNEQLWKNVALLERS